MVVVRFLSFTPSGLRNFAVVLGVDTLSLSTLRATALLRPPPPPACLRTREGGGSSPSR